ncbi:MAG: hypothetical protein ACM3PY_05895 [Omnitrophica WOR_2 bacterium]
MTWNKLSKDSKVFMLFLFVTLLFSGCKAKPESVLPAPTPTATEEALLPTATPTVYVPPTSMVSGLNITAAANCQAADLVLLRTIEPRGSLFSWSPQGDFLAYVSPSLVSSWLVGDLTLVSGPKFSDPKKLASDVVGDLAWSPDGQRIAYVALRGNDKLYTVRIIRQDGSGMVDVFPDQKAKTDEWSSPKAIKRWLDDHTLRIQVSCGSSCLQTVDYDLSKDTRNSDADPVKGKVDYWAVRTNQPETIPTEFAPTLQPNWAPDGFKVIYLDSDNHAWIADLARSEQYLLFPESLIYPVETEWSQNSHYVAIGSEGMLRVYSFLCTK